MGREVDTLQQRLRDLKSEPTGVPNWDSLVRVIQPLAQSVPGSERRPPAAPVRPQTAAGESGSPRMHGGSTQTLRILGPSPPKPQLSPHFSALVIAGSALEDGGPLWTPRLAASPAQKMTRFFGNLRPPTASSPSKPWCPKNRHPHLRPSHSPCHIRRDQPARRRRQERHGGLVLLRRLPRGAGELEDVTPRF